MQLSNSTLHKSEKVMVVCNYPCSTATKTQLDAHMTYLWWPFLKKIKRRRACKKKASRSAGEWRFEIVAMADKSESLGDFTSWFIYPPWKLTFSRLKMDGWNTIILFGILPIFWFEKEFFFCWESWCKNGGDMFFDIPKIHLQLGIRKVYWGFLSRCRQHMGSLFNFQEPLKGYEMITGTCYIVPVNLVRCFLVRMHFSHAKLLEIRGDFLILWPYV